MLLLSCLISSWSLCTSSRPSRPRLSNAFIISWIPAHTHRERGREGERERGREGERERGREGERERGREGERERGREGERERGREGERERGREGERERGREGERKRESMEDMWQHTLRCPLASAELLFDASQLPALLLS